jgi:hypothetical protein
MVFDNRALRGTLGPKKEITEGQGKIQNEELHNLYSSPHIIMVI